MDEIITINENFTFSGDIDQILTASSVNHFVIAYYYVPSFLVESSNLEEVTAETSIYGNICNYGDSGRGGGGRLL